MANNPSKATATVSGPPASMTCTPDPVQVVKGTNDGIEWTLNSSDYMFTGVTIDNVAVTPTGSGDFSGISIDNSDASKSVMTVNDSLAEIHGNVHSDDHSYTLNYQARSGGDTHDYDPTIRNHD